MNSSQLMSEIQKLKSQGFAPLLLDAIGIERVTVTVTLRRKMIGQPGGDEDKLLTAYLSLQEYERLRDQLT